MFRRSSSRDTRHFYLRLAPTDALLLSLLFVNPPAPGPGLARPRVKESGPFYTSESRGGVERRQMELKGTELGD